MTIDVFSKDNKLWSINPDNLGEALRRGGRLANAGATVKVLSNDGKEWDIKTENLKTALDRGGKLATPGITDYAQAGYQGVAKGLGKTADVAVAAGNAVAGGVAQGASYLADKVGAEGVAQDLNQFADESYGYAKDYWKNPKIEKVGSDLFDTGMSYDKDIRIAKNAGEMVGTLPIYSIAGKGVQLLTKAGGVANVPWVSKLNNFLKTDVNPKTAASFAGMGAGSEALKSDDPNTSEIENILREFGGGLLGAISIPVAEAAAVKSIKAIGELLSPEKWYELLVKTGNTTLDKEAIEATKNIGGKLDAKTIYKDNDMVSYVERVFSNKAYKIASKNANQDIISNIEQALNKELGEMPKANAQQSTVRSLTTEADSIIERLYEANKARKDELYKEADALVASPDVPLPNPSNSVKAAQEVLKKTYAPSTKGTTETGQGVTSSVASEIIKEWGDKNVVSYDTMVAQLRALGEQRRLAGSGYKEMFKSVEDAIKQDIGLVNPEYLKKYNIASEYYAGNIAPFVQLDAARALLTGEKPNFIWEHMNTPTNREEIRQALEIGGEQGKQLFESIKRAKSQAVIMERIQQDGMFKPDKFIELFTQLKPEDDIIDLVGKNTYNKIKDNALVLARKIKEIEVQGASGSQSNMGNILNKYGATTISGSVGAGIGAVTGGLPGAIVGGATGAIAKEWLSKAFAKASQNPKVIERLIAAAEKNNDKQFLSILDRALNATGKAIDSIANNPAIKYEAVKGAGELIKLNNNFDKNKFLEENKKWDDRSSFILTPEEMRKMREK